MPRFYKRLIFLVFWIILLAVFLPAGPFGWLWQETATRNALVVAYIVVAIFALRTLASLGDSDADEA